MKPFTESEMIRVAKAARDEYKVLSYNAGSSLAKVILSEGIVIEYDIEDDNFSMYQYHNEFIPCFPIQAVADTIREILKERGDDQTS